MAIVTFWSDGKEETAKTLSIAAVATNMALEHNYRVLLLSTLYDDRTLESCFFEKRDNRGNLLPSNKVNVDSGIEGLTKIIKSKRATADAVTNYTKVIFKDRLEILLGLKSKTIQEYEKARMIYPEVLDLAKEYYDMIFVDVNKGLDSEFARAMLEDADIIISTITQNTYYIDHFMEIKANEPLLQKDNNMILIGRYDAFSKYNAKNIERYMGEMREIITVPYNTLFFEACNDGKVADFFLRYKTVDKTDRNAIFLKEVNKATEKIDYRIKELQMKM